MRYFLILVLALASMGYSREVPDSLLTPDQLAKMNTSTKVEDAKANVAVASAYIGLGHEVGVAVNDAMSAITEQANKFAGTEVGQMVKWIILYKICKSPVIALFSIAATWFVLIIGNLVVYLGYVHKSRDVLFGNDSDNLVRGDVWLIILILSVFIGVISTWVSLYNIT
jgi:hypothetical protein